MLISGDQGLVTGCGAGEGERLCVLDVEFVRRRTYWPLVALVQLGFRGQEPLIIDAVAVRELAPLTAVLRRPDCLKILHAASQDLEALELCCHALPEPIFDTQVAAALCGHGYQCSLAASTS
jgi:ribonuclease D